MSASTHYSNRANGRTLGPVRSLAAEQIHRRSKDQIKNHLSIQLHILIELIYYYYLYVVYY